MQIESCYIDLMKLRLWCLLAQLLLFLMVGSLFFLGVPRVVELVTSCFVRTSIGTLFVWVVWEKKGWVLQATVVHSTICTTSASGLCSLYQAMPLNKESTVRDGSRWRGNSHQVWHQPESKPWSKSRKESLEDWSISAKNIVYFGLCDLWCFYYHCVSPPHETALAIPLALCDLQVGNPNPYQLTEGAPAE